MSDPMVEYVEDALHDVDALRLAARLLLERADREEAATQRECTHYTSFLRRSKYENPYGWGNGYPPLRVCTMCGLCEQGWGSGHKLLRTDSEESIPVLSRDGVLKLKRGKVHNG